jgi:ribosomal protein L5
MDTLESLFPNADLTNSVLTHSNVQTLITKLIKYVQLIPQYQKLKLNPELTKIVLNIIKSEIDKDTDPVDVLIQVLQPIFGLTSAEIDIIKQQATFLKDNNHIIGIPISKKYIKSATRWVTRKIG